MIANPEKAARLRENVGNLAPPVDKDSVPAHAWLVQQPSIWSRAHHHSPDLQWGQSGARSATRDQPTADAGVVAGHRWPNACGSLCQYVRSASALRCR